MRSGEKTTFGLKNLKEYSDRNLKEKLVVRVRSLGVSRHEVE